MSKEASVCGATAQLPPFWKEDPEGWFLSIDAQFILKGIKEDSTKFYYALLKLDSEVAKEVRDIAKAAPEPTSYQQLKARLCRSYELTPEERADKILDSTSLGDRKPSQLIRDLIHWKGDNNDEVFLLRRIFMRCLPQEIRSVVSCSGKKKLLERGEEADKAWATLESSKAVNAASSHSLGASEGYEHVGPKLCKFHKRFGDKAKKCRPFCKFWTKKAEKVNKVEDDESVDFTPSKNL